MNMEAVSDLRMGFLLLPEIIFCFLGLWIFFYIFIAVNALIYLGDNLGKRWIFIYLYGRHLYVSSFIRQTSVSFFFFRTPFGFEKYTRILTSLLT